MADEQPREWEYVTGRLRAGTGHVFGLPMEAQWECPDTIGLRVARTLP